MKCTFQCTNNLILNAFLDERHFLSGYDSALFYGAYAYQYDREASGRQYRYTTYKFYNQKKLNYE